LTGEKARKKYCLYNSLAENSSKFSSRKVREDPLSTGDRGRLMKKSLVALYDIPHWTLEWLFATKSKQRTC